MFACCCGAEAPQSRFLTLIETRYGWPPHIEAYVRSLSATIYRTCTYREDWDYGGCVGGFIVQVDCNPMTGVRTVTSETLNNWSGDATGFPSCLPVLVTRRVTSITPDTKTWNVTAFAQQAPIYGTGSLVFSNQITPPSVPDVIAAASAAPFGPWVTLIVSGALAAQAGHSAETFPNSALVNRGQIAAIPSVRRLNVFATKSEHRNGQRYCLKQLPDAIDGSFFTCETPLSIAGASVVILPGVPSLRNNAACQPEPQIGTVSCSLVHHTLLWWEPAWGATAGCCHA